MTALKAYCTECWQETELASADITLRVCNYAHLSTYSFTCPECLEEVCRPATIHEISLLTCGNVTVIEWTIPEGVLERKPGPAISYDDLLDFWLQLRGDDMLSLRAEGE